MSPPQRSNETAPSAVGHCVGHSSCCRSCMLCAQKVGAARQVRQAKALVELRGVRPAIVVCYAHACGELPPYNGWGCTRCSTQTPAVTVA